MTHTKVSQQRGVDWIKTVATERAGLPNTDPRKQTLTEADVRAVVEEANGRGVPVAAHAHGDEGGRAAVAGGVRSMSSDRRVRNRRGPSTVSQASRAPDMRWMMR